MVKDFVTQFEGRVMAVVTYWGGEKSALVVPTALVDGKRPDGEWFDVKRLERYREYDVAASKEQTGSK